ncbi:MAG TPA: hypothetical protein VGW33_09050 [Terriglobia bacterium]|nr:hypothetical protein [Terriglobia bacterium]
MRRLAMTLSHKTLALILLGGTLTLGAYEIGANHFSQSANAAGQTSPANQPAATNTSSANPAANPGLASDAASAPAGATNSPSASNSQGGGAPPEPQQLTVPDGTPVDVRLVDAVGSSLDRTGQTFAATLARPIEVDGSIVAPEGANVTGRVIEARPSGHLKTPAYLAVTLTSVEINGQSYDLSTSHRSWRGKSHKKRNVLWIAGATGAGALVGGLVGAGKGAAIGAGVGAGGGTATAYATGKKNIMLPSETRLRFVLRQPLTVTQA